jgi:hypothetical protein
MGSSIKSSNARRQKSNSSLSEKHRSELEKGLQNDKSRDSSILDQLSIVDDGKNKKGIFSDFKQNSNQRISDDLSNYTG